MMLQSASLLGPKISLQGNLRVEGDFHLYGNFEGDLHAEDESATIYLERGSSFKGKLFASSVHIQGSFEGTLIAAEAHIHPSAHVRGEIRAPKLEIDFGAKVEAKTISPK